MLPRRPDRREGARPLARSGLLLGAILAFAVLLRVGVAVYLGDSVDAPPLLVDQRSYDALGTRLLAGHGFSFDRGWYPFTPAETPTAHWSFLYSLYVAAVYGLFGVHTLAVRLVGALLAGVLLPWLVHRLARRLFPGQEGVALLAAVCAAVYGYFILYAATLMTEAFYIVVLLWSLERAMALAERPTLGGGVVLGLGLGLAALLRQSILPWVVMLFVWLLWASWRAGCVRRVVLGLTAATAIVALLILPFTVRNYMVYGEFLLLNSNAGYAMYSAQHPMHGTSFQEFAAAPVPDELRGLNEAQLDRELMRLGIGFVLAEPGRYLLLSLSRVRDYFEFWPTADTTLLHNVGRTASFGLFLPFMLAGIWLAVRQAGLDRSAGSWIRFSTTPLALSLLFMGFYSLLHILTWAIPRYRMPVDAVALPFAALALVGLAFAVGRALTSSSAR
jgi:hypothetical protein